MQAQPIPGLPIRAPLVSPTPGSTIVGYQIVEPHGGCNCDLRLEGWLAVIILLFFFFPLAWIPCCMQECAQRYQVPIYGSPGQVPAGGIPVGGEYQQTAYPPQYHQAAPPPQYEQPGYPQKGGVAAV